MSRYTIKQLADLAGVSRRTLHHYDQIGLLKPAEKGANRYRYYDDQAALSLQQILFYRELGLSLGEIQEILDQPDFDLLQALHKHKGELRKRVARLNRLIETVDITILHVKGEMKMSGHDIFEGFSEEQQEEYAQQARQRWDPKMVDQSMQLWKGYSPEKKQQVLEEGKAIYVDILEHMQAGKPPKAPKSRPAWFAGTSICAISTSLAGKYCVVLDRAMPLPQIYGRPSRKCTPTCPIS